MADPLDIPRFYQILGHKGHFKKDYWRWHPGADEPSHFHEFAHEGPAAKAIAGEGSALYENALVDAAGIATARSVELILGVKPWGAMSLLLDKENFEKHVWPQAGISGPTDKLIPLYPTSNYLSLSPIKFTSVEQLEEMFKALRLKKPSAHGRDDSKLNNVFTETSRSRVRTSSASLHIIIEEYESMSKTSPPKDTFNHGESTNLAESSIAGTLSSLIAPSCEASAGPLVLVTYDWPRTARLLNTHGIDTSKPNWHVGLSELLGFERPRQINEPQERDRDIRRNGAGAGAESRRDNGYQERNGYEERRPRGNRFGHQSVDDPDYDSKPKSGTKEESKPYGGRLDSSSPIRKRSQSPRSRARPLADRTDRKYPRLFLPDNDQEEGELSGSPTCPTDSNSDSNQDATPQIHIIDLRALFSTLLNAHKPHEYILYPPCARRLGFPVDGWCAGNQAVQMHKVLESLVGGEPIHRREAQLKSQPGLSPPAPPPSASVPTLLEGIAGGSRPHPIQASHQSFVDAWDDEDEDDW
ncbi:hypothetical protein FRC08_001394 [Ceratobasidium sp. 394]|nr:hypothetical protein FRC08_001394 [Ceratobasidium sp. 394]